MVKTVPECLMACPLVEAAFDWRWTLMEDKLWCKRTLDGRQALIEETHSCNKTFYGRYSLMEDRLRLRRIFDRFPFNEFNIWWPKFSVLKITNVQVPNDMALSLWNIIIELHKFIFWMTKPYYCMLISCSDVNIIWLRVLIVPEHAMEKSLLHRRNKNKYIALLY